MSQDGRGCPPMHPEFGRMEQLSRCLANQHSTTPLHGTSLVSVWRPSWIWNLNRNLTSNQTLNLISATNPFLEPVMRLDCYGFSLAEKMNRFKGPWRLTLLTASHSMMPYPTCGPVKSQTGNSRRQRAFSVEAQHLLLLATAATSRQISSGLVGFGMHQSEQRR
jgi:hypothetical protein